MKILLFMFSLLLTLTKPIIKAPFEPAMKMNKEILIEIGKGLAMLDVSILLLAASIMFTVKY